jgi:MoaE-MoaD fusion protein
VIPFKYGLSWSETKVTFFVFEDDSKRILPQFSACAYPVWAHGKLAVCCVSAAIMRIQMLFFGMMRDIAGTHSETIEMPEGTSIRDVLEHYTAKLPDLKAMLPSLAVALNQRYADADAKLKSEDEVALLPPVSGGAPERAGEQSAGRGEETATADLARGKLVGSEGRARIVHQPIDTQETLSQLKRGEDGAALIFEGVVRNQTRGRKTLYLDYEAYEEMALQQMESLATQALQQFQIRNVALVHRLGRLEIGETSVLIAVVSAHRAAAFEACRWLIDSLKRTVPIWKKEHFGDGAVWADGEPFPAEIPRAYSSGAGSPPQGAASK